MCLTTNTDHNATLITDDAVVLFSDDEEVDTQPMVSGKPEEDKVQYSWLFQFVNFQMVVSPS